MCRTPFRKHLPLFLGLLLCLSISLLCCGCGGEAPPAPEELPPEESATQQEAEAPAETEQPSLDKYQTEAVPEGKPIPVEHQDAAISETALSCTLEIRCDTILENMEDLDPEKAELIPADGVIFPAAALTFYEGESVFDLLQRACKQAAIHMEYVDTPVYNSAYIEGIHNLYEFDCGPLSGWMYEVNGWFPNYGCSRYQLQQGDVVIWHYTCDLGRDLGADMAAQQGQPTESSE